MHACPGISSAVWRVRQKRGLVQDILASQQDICLLRSLILSFCGCRISRERHLITCSIWKSLWRRTDSQLLWKSAELSWSERPSWCHKKAARRSSRNTGCVPHRRKSYCIRVFKDVMVWGKSSFILPPPAPPLNLPLVLLWEYRGDPWLCTRVVKVFVMS